MRRGNPGEALADRMNVKQADLHAEASEANEPIPAEPGPGMVERLTRRWARAAIRTKLSLLILAATSLGLVVGTTEAVLGHQLWPLLIGTLAAAGVLMVVAHHAIWAPLERLTVRAERVARTQQSHALRNLPMAGDDELGRLSRAMHRVATAAARDRQDAAQLRRTLDSRVEQAARRQTSVLQRQVRRDELTGLGNRRELEQRLAECVEQAQQGRQSLVCLMLDLDNFKQVNDTHGHAAGDRLLSFVGKLISGSIRPDDVAARLGGDEFAILLPGASYERGEQLAHSLRQLFAQHTAAAHREGPDADLSLGIAMLGEVEGDTGEALLSRADRRLYEAKRDGKGRAAGPGSAR